MLQPNSSDDRGIQKWQGFFLSEHSEQMEQEQQHDAWLEEMSAESIQEVLALGLLHQRLLVFQLKPKQDDRTDRYPEPLMKGYLRGSEGERLILQTNQGIQQIVVAQIHHVYYEERVKKWYT
ncbi:hypothetical protein [Listeria fleischmannii]|uniref:hypothetical protein n=1 Tax=Listeria fleischmannii TaxID=1069827 RepID=UPI0016252747|nr:hypothetical protein [Listeria fleischmannii]MBC1419920.1 hypothetical protein [Listeria fleischmannii]